MKKEPIYEYLRRRLSEHAGQHNRIARESGVPQATVSRLHAGQSQPRIYTVQALLDWFDRHDRQSARRIANAGRRLQRRKAPAATTLSQ